MGVRIRKIKTSAWRLAGRLNATAAGIADIHLLSSFADSEVNDQKAAAACCRRREISACFFALCINLVRNA